MIPRESRGFHGIPRDSPGFNGFRWDSVESTEFPWNPMGSKAAAAAGPGDSHPCPATRFAAYTAARQGTARLCSDMFKWEASTRTRLPRGLIGPMRVSWAR